jgi:hypothetical protein
MSAQRFCRAIGIFAFWPVAARRSKFLIGASVSRDIYGLKTESTTRGFQILVSGWFGRIDAAAGDLMREATQLLKTAA